MSPFFLLFSFYWPYVLNILKIIFPISLWMATFYILFLSKGGGIVISGWIASWDAKSYKIQSHCLQNNDFFLYHLVKIRCVFIHILYYIIMIILPLLSAIFYTIYSLFFKKFLIFIALYPLIIYVILSLIFISKSDERTGFIIFGIISICCTLVLWFYPGFHPYKIITIYLTTGEVVLAGILSSSN